jgi:hypothetical protein
MNEDVIFEEDFKFICEHLGSFVEEETKEGAYTKRYVKHPEVTIFLQDVLKALRRNTLFAIRLLAHWNTLKHHLLPLLITYQHDDSLAFQILRILTKITMPIESSSIDPEEVFPLVNALHIFKEELCGHYDSVNPFSIIVALMLSPLANYEKDPTIKYQSSDRLSESESDLDVSDIEEWEIAKSKIQSSKPLSDMDKDGRRDISEKEMQIIELGLTLIRNCLAISDDTSRVTAANLQSKVIACLDNCYVYELLVALSATLIDRSSKSFNFLLMEIFYRIFLGFSLERILPLDDEKQQVGLIQERVIRSTYMDLQIYTTLT